jgi:hypothetical protein
MLLPKNYIHDRLILLLLSVNAFAVLITILSIIMRIGSSSGSYIVQYRLTLGVNDFTRGSIGDILSFISFAVVVLAINFVLSARTYRIHRQLSVVILSVGALLLIFGFIVSNALLVLR